MGLIISIRGFTPKLAPDVFVADTAVISGDVEIGAGSSVWYGVSIRGDSAPIRLGERVNVQDNSVVHADPDAPVSIADDVSIGHSAIVHGATIGAGTLIGMGAILLSRSRVGSGAIVAAGSLVVEDGVVGDRELAVGSPAKPRRTLTDSDSAAVMHPAEHYHALGGEYRDEQLTRVGH